MNKSPAFSISSSDSQAGFSLIEVAIALLVIGLLVGLTLPLLRMYMDRTRLLKTQEHQHQIHAALKVYQQSHPHNTLPCPADPTAPREEKGYANCRTRNQEGLVPYRTLGLPEHVARDGYARYFTYVVEHNLTRPMDDFDTIKGGHIQVFDSNGRPVLDEANKQNFITFVLLSHGPSGCGSFHPQGHRLPLKPNSCSIKMLNSNSLPEYQLGSEDNVYWVSQMSFRSDAYLR